MGRGNVLKAPASPLLGGSIAQRLRIASGLILFTFALTHFLNHALGIWSLDVMEMAQGWRTAVTRSTAGTIVLASAFLTHVTLNLTKLALRSTWRMPVWEAVQIALGLSIPLLLVYHAAYIRGMHVLDGSETAYFDLLPGLWNNAALQQSTLLLLVWTHGCIGLHYWLRLGRFYRRIAPVLLGAAVLVPALALAGFVVAGRQAAELTAESQAEATAATPADSGDSYGGSDYGGSDYGGSDYGGYDSSGDDYGKAPPAASAKLTPLDVRRDALWITAAVLALVAVVLAARAALRLTHRRIRIDYTAGPSITVRVGPTLLELSRMSGIPHTSICGGRARCSTCRVKVEDGGESLPPPGDAEAATLKRIHADEGTRLACQIRPHANLTVTRLIRPPDEKRTVFPASVEEAGVERTLAIFFLDIRGFTTLSEARLPYDTVFLLNRFFGETGEAVATTGGWIDKYMGDGMMALFGINQPIDQACRAALLAATRIDAALERLNRELAGELAAPLKIGIGLHIGPLVLGRIGHRASAATTVIGPAVNVASRLESLTKEHGVQIVASSELAAKAGVPPDAFPEVSVTVRGASEPVHVLLIESGRALIPYLENRRSTGKHPQTLRLNPSGNRHIR
jgi:adenylate cyclase